MRNTKISLLFRKNVILYVANLRNSGVMKENLCFIDEAKCDMFSKLDDLDLKELLLQINNFYLTYRDTLHLPSDLSFGCEIEYEGIDKEKVDRYVVSNLVNWKSKTDETLHFKGGEVNSPILYDEKKCWEELKSICEFLKEKGAITTKNAGGHVHIGAHILEFDHVLWRRFLKVYTAYEHILFRFGYGDKINARPRLLYHAFPVESRLHYKMPMFDGVDSFYDMKDYIPADAKRQAVNFCNVRFLKTDIFLRNTVEFRFPNATDEEVIWQNNINAFSKMMLAPKKDIFDEEFLDHKLKWQRVSSDYKYDLYSKVCLENALEFVDLVFDNNLDKVYFLRQYIKDFEETDKKMAMIKSKRFID